MDVILADITLLSVPLEVSDAVDALKNIYNVVG